MQIHDPDSLKKARARYLRWGDLLTQWQSHSGSVEPLVHGSLVRARGLALEATGCHAPIGGRCLVENTHGDPVETEVVGFADNHLYLMPTAHVTGIAPRAKVTPLRSASRRPVGDMLLGRVVDATGQPLDSAGPLRCIATAPLQSPPINPLKRLPIHAPFDVGVRSLNALLTTGRGQRLGLFAGSGVGKSSLLAMMTRYAQADVIVVGLIGERGREVREFVEESLGPEGLARAVVIATPSDAPALMRLHGAWYATAVAEHFRDNGKHVLFLMDSLTRFAQAQREIGLSIGEPPTTKGYPPSVFARLPELIERTGNGTDTRGSITAFYTVLIEGEDHNDPIVDSARATLDGHVMLSRDIAESGIYPPIDIEKSVSRSMHKLIDDRHQASARRFRELYAHYMRNRDAITLGAYSPGADPKLDSVVRNWPLVEAFLKQDLSESITLESSIDALHRLVAVLDQDPGNEGQALTVSQ